jgi:molybdopterin converting factor small subunit
MAINVRVLFFGATASVVGQRSVDLQLPEDSLATTAFDQSVDRFPDLKRHKLLCALNENYLTGQEVLHDGDELAIFTAVSGG